MNHYDYFTEIEQRFQQRRGSILMLSTLDWTLIETWREAGIPLAAVLRGIDDAFDKHDAQVARAAGRSRRIGKINGLAWAAQPVMLAAHAFAEAAIGMASAESVKPQRESGFETGPVTTFLLENAAALERCGGHQEAAARLRELASELTPTTALEDLDRTLTVLEEKIFAGLLASAPESELVDLRAQADHELAPYRGKMQAVQIRQVQQQFLHKRLFAARGLPRLSLFYMTLR